MSTKNTTLASVLLSVPMLGKVGGNAGLSANELRVLGLVSVLGDVGRIVQAKDVARMLGHATQEYEYPALARLLAAGLLERQKRGKASGWLVTVAGARVLSLLEREERAVRRKVREYSAGLKLWPRKYERSDKWYLSRGLPIPPKV